MKRLNTDGFGLIPIILMFFAVLAAGIVAWQITKNKSPASKATPRVNVQANLSCGNDTTCFYQAYSNGCKQNKTIKVTRITVEGDPIYTSAKLSSGPSGCEINVTVDTSKDKFGENKIYTHTCKKLSPAVNAVDKILVATECTGTPGITSVTI